MYAFEYFKYPYKGLRPDNTAVGAITKWFPADNYFFPRHSDIAA
jgi:hypothetical protein